MHTFVDYRKYEYYLSLSLRRRRSAALLARAVLARLGHRALGVHALRLGHLHDGAVRLLGGVARERALEVLRLDGGLLGGRAARGRALGLDGRGFVGDGEEQAAVRRARAREQPRDASSHESIKPIFGAREGRAGDRGRTCATQTRTGARTAKKAAVADMVGKV